MAKCRMLLQENEELGKMISSGRTAKLESEIALQKTMVAEMKNSQDGEGSRHNAKIFLIRLIFGQVSKVVIV